MNIIPASTLLTQLQAAYPDKEWSLHSFHSDGFEMQAVLLTVDGMSIHDPFLSTCGRFHQQDRYGLSDEHARSLRRLNRDYAIYELGHNIDLKHIFNLVLEKTMHEANTPAQIVLDDLGFYLYPTGGGCESYALFDRENNHIRVTDDSGSGLPNVMGEAWVGLYNGEGIEQEGYFPEFSKGSDSVPETCGRFGYYRPDPGNGLSPLEILAPNADQYEVFAHDKLGGIALSLDRDEFMSIQEMEVSTLAILRAENDDLKLAKLEDRIRAMGRMQNMLIKMVTGLNNAYPTIVVQMDGGAIHHCRSSGPARLVMLDNDTEGAEPDKLRTVDAEKVYLHDYVLTTPGNSSTTGIDPTYVASVVQQLSAPA